MPVTGEAVEHIWHPMIELQRILVYHKVQVFGGHKLFSFWYVNWDSHPSMWYIEDFHLTFSCGFNLKNYPFDSHVCKLEYADQTLSTEVVILGSPTIIYEDKSHSLGDDPIIIENSNLPFKFYLNTTAAYEKKDLVDGYLYSFTGLTIKISRKSYSMLLSGYFYPMAAFALLSMISYLIKPDMVSNRD